MARRSLQGWASIAVMAGAIAIVVSLIDVSFECGFDAEFRSNVERISNDCED